ncbi:hypothetical protein QTP86_027140 [Hemibagrus guttatus]|nr:hypothetical protein QTP86_027140 [Hemibagrus guttatus]
MENVGEEDTALFSTTENRDITDISVGEAGSECEPLKSLEDPPVDWFEPLEEDWEDDDDAQSWDVDGARDAEMESLAGESEKSGSVAGSERNYRRRGGGGAVGKRKRKWRFGSNDGWEDCAVLGEGWKRKVVLRRSGVSVGQRDVYYLSPKGERVRSKIELLKYIGNTVDLTNFDFKTGIFLDGEPSKKGMKTVLEYQHQLVFLLWMDPPYIPSNSCLGICVRCRNSFTSVEGQTMCEKCSKACNASKDNRNITFRKWLPCGFCRACQLTEDCGVCASCRNGKLNPQYRRPIRCRKRKCLCPSLKRRADDVLPVAQCGSVVDRPERLETTNMASKPSPPDFKESQYSDSDDQSPFYEENDSEGLLRKFRRSCGRCKGCVAKADCGTCDYCIDKPKFGGSNKKRQKCRQRQCQREAKGWTTPGRPRPHYAYSHKILRRNREKWDFEFSDNECEKERIAKGSVVGVRYVERDKHCISDYNGQGANIEASQALSEDHLLHLFCDKWTRVSDGKRQCPPATRQNAEEPDEDEVEPTITQILSLGGDSVADDGLDLELLELLASLRDAPLPVLWCAVLAEGPRLQLLQCSKLSAMADTTVQIEPSFRYHISVQGQPLLPTHWLYHAHPVRLTSVAQVNALLEDLERYSVCRGFKTEPPFGPEPIVQVRAATCEFLVVPENQSCARCKNAQHKY